MATYKTKGKGGTLVACYLVQHHQRDETYPSLYL